MMPSSPTTSLDGFHATPAAERADELVRAFVAAVDDEDYAAFDAVLARTVLSYDLGGDVYTRTGLKKHYQKLHRSFVDLHFEVHENVGVLVEDNLVAVRTIVTGTHSGDYEGVAATGKQIQTSTSHFFRLRDDMLAEHWHITDTYRILAKIGRVPGVASEFQRLLGVPVSSDGIFEERLGTDFGASRSGRRVTREESRAVGRRLFDGAIATGDASDVEVQAEGYMQNSGWTPDGRDAFGKAWAIGRGAMPDGLAVQTHVVAEKDRVAAISAWDGTITASGQAVDFVTADFLRIENGVAAEHWDTVDYIRLYQSFGLLPTND
jgi:predicted ester cyclase